MAYCAVGLYIVVTDLNLEIGEHLCWTAKLTYNFTVKCNRFGELVPNMLDCHVSDIPFQLMCQGCFFQCSSPTVSVLILCIISCVCLSGMEAISLLLLKTSWIMSKVVQYWKGWVITQIHLIHVKRTSRTSIVAQKVKCSSTGLKWKILRKGV